MVEFMHPFEDLFQPMSKEDRFRTHWEQGTGLGRPLYKYAEKHGIDQYNTACISPGPLGLNTDSDSRLLDFVKGLKLLDSDSFPDDEGQETEVREYKGHPIITFRCDTVREPKYIALHIEKGKDELIDEMWKMFGDEYDPK